jgi:hypothetical protein
LRLRRAGALPFPDRQAVPAVIPGPNPPPENRVRRAGFVGTPAGVPSTRALPGTVGRAGCSGSTPVAVVSPRALSSPEDPVPAVTTGAKTTAPAPRWPSQVLQAGQGAGHSRIAPCAPPDDDPAPAATTGPTCPSRVLRAGRGGCTPPYPWAPGPPSEQRLPRAGCSRAGRDVGHSRIVPCAPRTTTPYPSSPPAQGPRISTASPSRVLRGAPVPGALIGLAAVPAAPSACSRG